ncbi:hypothetical protein PGT21_011621 [Puccinia graminis f. sp. tritici]|uniref:Uncharacterized protein n=1 Tax=Puccinia graminis f. sp. tritici TaxID=56615 RepID=A0A5B0MWF6_PUCGR|nr:hypothetical protein PGT21_011621 [Puccinia graminis f. sp. tritici]
MRLSHRIGVSDAGPRIASPALAKPMRSIGIASISDAIADTLLAMPILSAGIASVPLGTTPLRDSSPSYIDEHLIPNDRHHSSSYLSVHSLPHISPIKFRSNGRSADLGRPF